MTAKDKEIIEKLRAEWAAQRDAYVKTYSFEYCSAKVDAADEILAAIVEGEK